MTQYPEFQAQGYEIEKILGANKSSGRVTYLAQEKQSQRPVVIKQFQFAQGDSTWSDYTAYEREIAVLQKLSSPHIPRYLDTLETPLGFSFIQEYKNAVPLSEVHDLSQGEIFQVATTILEVLVYLQCQEPPIFHRDLKPENILIERSHPLQIYLVDFGFAREGTSNLAPSSMVKGTLGYMPPEQLYQQDLTPATDLYSLGMTLIGLLTRTRSGEIGRLINKNNKLHYKKKLAFSLNWRLIQWLDQMVHPNLERRFPDALTALKALKKAQVMPMFYVPFASTIAGFVIVGSVGLLLGLHTLFSSNQPVIITPPPPPEEPIPGDLPTLVKQLLETGECQGCNLQGADLSGMDFSEMNLKGANLEGADLRKTNFKGANLKDANLARTNLTNSDFSGANLKDANLTKANLTKSHFEKANLLNANLEGAIVKETIFWEANIKGTGLPESLSSR